MGMPSIIAVLLILLPVQVPAELVILRDGLEDRARSQDSTESAEVAEIKRAAEKKMQSLPTQPPQVVMLRQQQQLLLGQSAEVMQQRQERQGRRQGESGLRQSQGKEVQQHEQLPGPEGEHFLSIRTWLHGLSFFFLIKAACMLSNMVFQVSPIPLVQKIRNEKDTGDIDAAPLVTIAFGGLQWSFYGVFAWLVTGKTGFLVVFYANVFGAILGMFYVGSFQSHCRSASARATLRMYYTVIVALILLQGCVMALLPQERALLFSGFVASSCTVASALAPMTVVPGVFETKNSEAVPLALVTASLVSGGLWLLCGLLLWDAWIAIPNTVGLCANLFLIALVTKYPRAEPTVPKLPVKKVNDGGDTWEKLPTPPMSEQTPFGRPIGCSGGTF